MTKPIAMKILRTLCLLLCLGGTLSAQDKTLNALNSDIQTSSNDSAIRESLVSLALQNCDKKISDLQVNIAKDHIGAAKAGWLNTMFVSSYWNEFSINPTPKDQYNFYYPKYNMGISIPLGLFITVPKNVKMARSQYRIAEEQQKLKVLSIKNQVLTKYEDFVMFKQQLTIQSVITDNEYNALLQAEKKFRSGEIDVNAYNLEIKNYNVELSKKITIRHNLAIAKLDLEELIGTSLENVIR